MEPTTFDWKYVNYAPITVLVVIVVVGIWWLVSAHNTSRARCATSTIEEALDG